jgi:predicted flavoprotein YhiN
VLEKAYLFFSKLPTCFANMSAMIAVIGSGPAGLMVAHKLALQGHPVSIYERRPSLGRKILVAGSSGLNVSFEGDIEDFLRCVSGPPRLWREVLTDFGVPQWLAWIEQLGLETFLGTSGRYFVRGMKGASLLKSWTDRLKELGVQFHLPERQL